MKISLKEYVELRKEYPEGQEVLDYYHEEWDNEGAFKKLVDIKGNIPERMYGFILAIMYGEDTEGVSYDTLKAVFSGISRDKLMSEDELKKYDELPDNITVFRGTEDRGEEIPRLSWSLKKEVALRFARAHLFKAVIPKERVIAYFSEATDEEEILALITEGYEIIR